MMKPTCINRCARTLVCASLALAVAGCNDDWTDIPRGAVTLNVLSSAPDQVSGGDARIEVKAPISLQDKIGLWLNGAPIAPPMERHADRMEGVVTGLVNGQNRLEVRHLKGEGEAAAVSVVLTNHPVTGPMFSGPQQQPFFCRAYESGLGQPLVDNRDAIGHPVFNGSASVPAGYSKYCSIDTRIAYYYFTGGGFNSFDPATDYAEPPSDLRTIAHNGANLPFVVRVEVGTINRFFYTIATLAPLAAPAAAPARFDKSYWNGKLIYWMRGGVGIGRQQGTAMWFNGGLNGSERELMPRLLAQGYAIASSSGNQTGVHYNMRLAEETALMTKERFIKAYGKPRFVIGIGGSGGAVQQYLFAQNRPGLLDGGIPVQSYPDMVTQTIPISDCPLLGQYFKDEVALDPASPWATWSRQRLIEGMNASDTVRNALFGNQGSTECINGWRNAMPTVLNPFFKDAKFDKAAGFYRYAPGALEKVRWTHWDDLANIYGAHGRDHAPDSIDNVGVQYGLGALAKGQIGVDEFLRINACVGGWKEQPAFVAWDQKGDPFDARNMTRSATCREPAGAVAPRRKGELSAIRNAYASGHVFTGQRLGIPMVDLRPYLEGALDMHNARQAFSVRARLRDANAEAAGNQVIWVIAQGAPLVDSVMDALATLDGYLGTGKAPSGFADKCVAASGAAIAAGPSVWDGILDKKAPGACTSAYPVFSSPRMVAGESIKGDVFKCALKPVATALADGTYPPAVQFTPQQQARLEQIFPDGVCDYAKPGQMK